MDLQLTSMMYICDPHDTIAFSVFNHPLLWTLDSLIQNHNSELSRRTYRFNIQNFLESSSLVRVSALHQHAFTSDHNGFGPSRYSTTLVSEFRAQVNRPSWTQYLGFCRVANSPLIPQHFHQLSLELNQHPGVIIIQI